MYFIFFFKNVIEYFYIKHNQTTIIFKKDFNDLPFFEKTFLSFFYRKNIFNKSIANIYKNNSLINYRQKNYPLVFFFHLYFDRMDYSVSNINTIKKQFYFFFASPIFSKTLNNVKFIFFKNKKNLNDFLIFLIIQKFFFKRYYNLCSSIYFNNFSDKNTIKLNWLFFIFLTNSKGLFNIYDLSKYSDWYDFNFKLLKNYKKNKNKFLKIKNNSDFNNNNKFKSDKFNYLNKIYLHYNLFFKKIYLKFNKKYKNIFLLDFGFFKTNKFKLNSNWLKNLIFFYPTRFSESSVSKHIKLDNLNNYIFFYIRKNRIFNKGRYSRNRQLYRTGVYWCLWLNIMLVYGLYFMFYRFTFNFGYFWWGLLFFAYSTIFSRVLKYNFFNIFYLKNEFFLFLKWLGFILINFKSWILYFFKKIVLKNVFFLFSFFKNIWISDFFYKNIITTKLYFYSFFKFKDSGKFIYFWESMSYKDESFLRYKSILHWFNQLYKLLSY